MKIIKQKYEIETTPEKVWQALVDEKVIDDWGGGPAEMDDKVGTEFKLWGGDIWGKNLEVDRHKKLVQEWYGGNWSQPSTVTFLIKGDGNKTELELVHENVPDSEEKDISDGWKSYYLGPMKEMLEM